MELLKCNPLAQRAICSPFPYRDLLHTSLAMPSACSERSNSFQIVWAEGSSMTHHLEDQARRAERLARSILDDVTIERLLAFAAECRQKVKAEELQPAA